jgi:hypothetical protein
VFCVVKSVGFENDRSLYSPYAEWAEGWPEYVRGYGHVKDACLSPIGAKRNSKQKLESRENHEELNRTYAVRGTTGRAVRNSDSGRQMTREK